MRIASPPRAALLLASLALLASLPALATPARAAEGAGGCPNATLSPRAGNAEAIREAVLCLVNREREAHGESALTVNAKLTRAAQGHSEDMASGDYFSHYAPDGSSPLDRMRATGYIYNPQLGYEVGENIAWGTLWLASPQSIVNSWMASPEHRANILDGGYRETGIGISPQAPASMSGGQAGGLYTQDFGTIFSAGHTARHPGARKHASTGEHPRTLSSEEPRHSGSATRSRHHGGRRGHRRSGGHRRRATARRGSEPRSFQRSRHPGAATRGSGGRSRGSRRRHRRHRRHHHRRHRRRRPHRHHAR